MTAPDSTVAPDTQTAIHLPLADPYQAPTGYPIKADTKSGLYWAPESDLYDHVPRRGLLRQRGIRPRQRFREGRLAPRQIFRMTVTTLPRTAASLPGIGSNAGLCGISHT